jgi:hypothetical protein
MNVVLVALAVSITTWQYSVLMEQMQFATLVNNVLIHRRRFNISVQGPTTIGGRWRTAATMSRAIRSGINSV